MPLNRECMGKEYKELETTIRPEDQMGTINYARGYNDNNPWFIDESREGGVVAPPLYAVVYSGPAMAQGMFDGEIGANFARLVHGEQDIRYHRLLKPGDVIKSKAKIVGMEEKASGEILEIGVESRDQNGDLVMEGKYGFFIRGEKKGEKKETKPAEEVEKPEIVFSQSMEVTEDQTYRYADASGDHNPIHVDDNFAKSVGLGGIILQGLCSMAFTSKAVMDEYLDRDPSRLKRIKVRFSKPVRPKDTITTEGWVIEKKDDITVLGFEAKNQDGVPVIKNGIAEVTA